MSKAVQQTKSRATQSLKVASPEEISLNDKEFDQLKDVIQEMTGIHMSDSKRHLVFRRLSRRLKALGITSFQKYIDLLSLGDKTEVELFSNAVTTNLTSFFRENHHFEYLRNTIIPELLAAKSKHGKRLRIWSAGCSTGEEPYSIAMTMHEAIDNLPIWDAKLLCTDLDTDVVATAVAGIYSDDRIKKMPKEQLKRWFQHCKGDKQHMVRVVDKLRENIIFKQLNLMHDWPMRGKFDVIFCRNVVIYFDKPTQRILMDRFANILEDGGYLVLGHSESLYNVSSRFKLIGTTIHQKES